MGGKNARQHFVHRRRAVIDKLLCLHANPPGRLDSED
jgi:hypothetical protein